MYIQYPDNDCQFLEKYAACIGLENGEEYFYFPHYMRKVGIGIYEEMSFENLPLYVKDMIIKIRNNTE